MDLVRVQSSTCATLSHTLSLLWLCLLEALFVGSQICFCYHFACDLGRRFTTDFHALAQTTYTFTQQLDMLLSQRVICDLQGNGRLWHLQT